jgi:hypothetical protein
MNQRYNNSTKCGHCQLRHIGAGRGLCRKCYADESIRAQYKPLKDCGNKDHVGLTAGVGEAEPTDAMPGTPGKVEAMEARAAAGLPLWARGDARG